MKHTPVINCPSCNMPYTSAQLGFGLVVGPKYTVICGFNDNKGRKVGCGACFDFEIVDKTNTLPTWKKWLGHKETSELEVKAKVRGD